MRKAVKHAQEYARSDDGKFSKSQSGGAVASGKKPSTPRPGRSRSQAKA